MKKILSILLILMFLLGVTAMPSYAASTAQMKVDSAYYTAGTLYAYVEPQNGSDPATLTVKPRSDSSGVNNDSPKPITETDTTIDYILLIDASASIRSYLNNVFDFVSGLMNTEALQTTIAVASFGEDFHLVADGLTDPSQVSDVVENQISYTEDYTDICGGVIKAIEYIHSKNRTDSEVINLVVITDGKPDLKNPSGSALVEIADKAEAIVTTSPEIILHTICFGGDWEENTIRALSKGSGINENLSAGWGSESASVAGSRMATMIDSLYTFSLDFSWDYDYAREDIDLRVQTTDNPSASLELFTVENVANLEHIADADGSEDNNAPIFVLSTETPSEGDIAQPATGEEPTGEAPTQAAAATTATPSDALGGLLNSGWFIWLLIAVGAVVLIAVALIVVIVILSKKKKTKSQTASSAAPVNKAKKADGPAIMMQLQITQGNIPDPKKEIRLTDEIIIGSASDCDIVINDPAVAEHNTRIFVENGFIYIDNMTQTQNTYLEGMKIFSKNRLRSKDEISIGNTSFKLLF